MSKYLHVSIYDAFNTIIRYSYCTLEMTDIISYLQKSDNAIDDPTGSLLSPL